MPLSRYGTRIVAFLLLVEAVSVFLLWSLSSVSQAGEGVFALFLAIDLVSLAMISNATDLTRMTFGRTKFSCWQVAV